MSFSVCARCNAPVKLEHSVAGGLGQSQFDMLASHLSSMPPSELTSAQLARMPPSMQTAYLRSQQQKSNRATPCRFRSPADSFIVLGESQLKIPTPNATSGDSKETKEQPTAHRLALTQKLFSMLSSHSDVDHPLCIDCADMVQDMMQKQLEEIKQEKERYANFEKSASRIRFTDQDMANLRRDIENLESEAVRTLDQLRAAEAEEAQLDEELKKLDMEEEELTREEEEFWADHSAYTTELQALQSQYRSVQAQYAHDARELEKLQKTNVYNDAFCIGHEGGVATINGLRLGRLPSVPVDWPEVNAAWGHTVLLLHTLSRKWEHSFETYRLIPMASFSKVERIADKTIMELYGSGDFAFGRLLLNRRFDQAMVAFLECLRQIMEVAKHREPTLRLPFAVNKDKIGEVSIKLQFSSDETWTRALRHVLLTLKMLLVRIDERQP